MIYYGAGIVKTLKFLGAQGTFFKKSPAVFLSYSRIHNYLTVHINIVIEKLTLKW